MNNHVSRNKFFKEYNQDYACDPQKHIPRKFVQEYSNILHGTKFIQIVQVE